MRTAAIITSFNQQEFIQCAINSIQSQVDEVIVVDDASTDDSWRMISSMTAPNVKPIRLTANSGVSEACNIGISSTDADLLFFMGGDDISSLNRVAIQQLDIEANDSSMSFSVPEIISSDGKHLPISIAPEFSRDFEPETVLESLYFHGNFICAPSVALRRDAALRVGGFWPHIDLLQDFDLWLKIAENGVISRVSEPVVKYRKHGANSSREENSRFNPRRKLLSAEMDAVLEDFIANCSEETLRRLAAHKNIPLLEYQDLERKTLEGMIQVCHENQSVVRSGLRKLYVAMQHAHQKHLLQDLGVGAREIKAISNVADHENSMELSRLIQRFKV